MLDLPDISHYNQHDMPTLCELGLRLDESEHLAGDPSGIVLSEQGAIFLRSTCQDDTITPKLPVVIDPASLRSSINGPEVSVTIQKNERPQHLLVFMRHDNFFQRATGDSQKTA